MPSRDEVFDRFFHALRSGSRPEIREYLALGPEECRGEMLEDMVFEAMCWRIHQGEAVDVDEVLARFPELRPSEQALRDEEESCRRRAAPSTELYARPETDLPATGPEIDGYGPLERIGSGGMASVYKARNLELGRDEAIKIPHADLLNQQPDFARRFKEEAKSAAQFSHANIAQVYRIGECAAGPFLAMEFISGCPIRMWLKAGTPPAWQLAEVMAELAIAVHCVHRRGLVHRDITPKNIIINSEEDGRAKPVLLDFGLAKPSMGPSADRAGHSVAGTPAFMAPEQATGYYESRTDVYGLGATIHALLRERPSTGSDGPVAPGSERRPGIERGLDAILKKALAFDLYDRYASAAALAEALRSFSRRARLRDAVGAARRGLLRYKWTAMASLSLVAVLTAAIARRGGGHAPGAGSSASRQTIFEPRRKADEAGDRRPSAGSRWQTVLEQNAPFSAVPEFLAGDASVRLVGEALGREAGSSQPFVVLRDVDGVGTEVRATFGYPEWTRSGRLGLVVDAVDGPRPPGYQFLITSGTNTAGTLMDARDKDEFVAARIIRNGSIVREHRWRASALPDGPLELTVTRRDDQFAFRVGSLQPPLELIDIMHLVPSGGPAAFGLDWPTGVVLKCLRVRTRDVSRDRSPLKDGDDLYNKAEFADAAEFFEEQARSDPEAAVEARYKRALCLTRTSPPRLPEAVALFAAIVQEGSAARAGAPRRRWRVPAAFQAWRAWRVVRAQDKDIPLPSIEESEAVLTSARADPDDDALVPSLTQDEVDEFIKHLAPYAFSTSPYHLLKDDRQRIASLEKAVHALDRLDGTKVASVGPRQELLRAHFSERNYARAEQLAAELLREPLDQDWRLTVTRDAVWLAIEQSRQPDLLPDVKGRYLGRAIEVVESGLRDPVRPDRYRAGCRPLLVERARLHAVKEEWAKATDDLDAYFREVGPPDLPTFGGSGGARFAPSQSVPALFHLEAFLLRGFLLEKTGGTAAARTAWKQGFEWVRGNPAISDFEAAMLGSLGDVLEQDDADHMITVTAGGAGLLGSELISYLFRNMNSYRDLATSVLRRAWQSDRGHELARRVVLRELNFRDALGTQIQLAVYEGSRQGVAGPPGHGNAPTAPQDELLWQTTEWMLRDFRSGKLTEFHLGILFTVARGDQSFLGTPARRAFLRDDLWRKSDWSGGLAYVLGCHYENNLNDPAFAAELFREAADIAPAGSPLRKLVEAKMTRPGSKR